MVVAMHLSGKEPETLRRVCEQMGCMPLIRVSLCHILSLLMPILWIVLLRVLSPRRLLTRNNHPLMQV